MEKIFFIAVLSFIAGIFIGIVFLKAKINKTITYGEICINTTDPEKDFASIKLDKTLDELMKLNKIMLDVNVK